MKKLGFLLLLVGMAVMLGGTALAQDTDSYFVTYFSNANTANAPDATLRIVNDGVTDATIYAQIYVFDDSEELQECCSCAITPDGLLSESIKTNLTANPITGIKPTRGVIKVLASCQINAQASFAGTVPPLVPGLHGWATHVQKLVSGFAVTEGELADANYSTGEGALLEQLCYFDAALSGKACTCTAEDNDF